MLPVLGEHEGQPGKQTTDARYTQNGTAHPFARKGQLGEYKIQRKAAQEKRKDTKGKVKGNERRGEDNTISGKFILCNPSTSEARRGSR